MKNTQYENTHFVNICKIYKIISGQFYFHPITYSEDQKILTLRFQLFT